jgi:hypothetical protein
MADYDQTPEQVRAGSGAPSRGAATTPREENSRPLLVL